MRGPDAMQEALFSFTSLDGFVPRRTERLP
jgi:hypothetical protein